MNLFLQHEPDEPFVRFGNHFKDCPRRHALKLWKKKRRPVEVRDDHNVVLAVIYMDGNLVIYRDQEHREIVQ